jgi:hypothetical protein
MSELSMIKELTVELNNIEESIATCENQDNKITLLFRKAVIIEKIRKLTKGLPVAMYEVKSKKPYLLYSDGRREYKL